MTTETLTEYQDAAVQAAKLHIVDSEPLYRIGGYAGTGKTTIARHIVEDCPGAMVCAFTGKAAYRLRQKGLPQAQTIHRTIYHYDPGTDKFIKKVKDNLDGCYFLIDEGSMISKELWDDITHFELPVILLGDPGQLEPVGNDPNLMKDPDIVLDKIHRQAAGSGIIQFATNIRKGEYAWHCPSFYGEGNEGDGSVEIIQSKRPTKEQALEADIILCGRNATRHRINKWYRELQGYKAKWPVCPGEKIIILKNNMELGIFNGQILTVNEAAQKSEFVFEIDCYDEMGGYDGLPVFTGYFGKNADHAVIKTIRGMAVADWAYAITCHKSQGSEWDNVIVIDQQCPLWSAKRWRYTAITRAAKTLKYFVKK
jgi:exodeoxyribonuclease-5